MASAKEGGRHRYLAVLLGIAGALIGAPAGAGEAGEPVYRRWAVISSPGLRESGLADLVMLDLLKLDGIELVERDRIDAVLKEHRLEAALGSGAVGARLRMGRLLEADALVLLSEARAGTFDGLSARVLSASKGAGGARHVKLVVSDCRHGARLRIEFIPLVEGELKEVARSAARTVDETRARFSRGVERIVGVSHFVSRNLVHDYDHLQAGFAYLLESALVAYPGVAVIETEEAHAIRREFELAGALRLAQDAGTEFVEGAGGTVRRVVPLVVEGEFEVAGAVSKRNETVRIEARVSDATRVVRTISRRGMPLGEAAEFVRAGLARAVAGLSEGAAAKPFPAEKQFAWLASRADVFSRLGAWEHATGLREAALLLDPGSGAQRRKLVEEYCRIVRRPFNLPESVRRGAGIEPYERACALKLSRWRFGLEHLESLIRNGLIERKKAIELSERWLRSPIDKIRGYGSRHLSAAELTKKAFLREVYPLVLELESSIPSRTARGQEYEQWRRVLKDSLRLPYEGNFYRQADHVLLAEILWEYPLKTVRRPAAPGRARPLAKAAEKNAKAPPRKTISSRVQPTVVAKRSRFTFAEAPMRIKRLSGETVPLAAASWRRQGHVHLLRCTDSLDVVWLDGGAVYLMREKGLLDEAAARPKRIQHAVWDGRALWLATGKAGIWVVDASGRVLGKITSADGLPPCERGIKLHPLGPGRVFAAGSFGEHHRGWCAIVEWNGKAAHVNVFHEATRVLSWEERRDKRLREVFGGDPTIAFVPHWVHEYQHDRGDGSRVLLVGRWSETLPARTRPLEIGLESLKVTVSEFRLGFADDRMSSSYFSRDGEIYEATDFHVTRRAPPGSVFDTGRDWINFCTPRNRGGASIGGLLKTLLPYRDFLYVPASTVWFRFDPETMAAEQLVPDRLARPYSQIRWVFVSAHYGLLGYTGKGFFQIVVE